MLIAKFFILSLVQFYYSQGFQLVTFPTDAIVKEGSKFTLECTFSSPPILTTWLFNDVDTNITVTISNSSTLVRTASTETAGYYRCEASYQLGTVVSEPALIQIGYIYTTVDTPVDVVGYENSWLLLSCDHVLSLPQATVLWLKEDLIERLITGSDSLEILLNGSLLFSDLSSADEAMYICLASNPSTLEFRRVVYNLTISTGLLEISGVPSQLLFLTPTDIVVSAGENVIFQCFIISSDSMQRWYHEDSLISEDSSSYSILDNGVTLVVERVDTEQSGEYRCEAEGLGSVSGNLYVIDTPVIYLTGSADIESDLETSFSLTCSLKAGVTVEWSWLKNGELLNEPIWIEGELRVSFAQESDEGLYQCVAYNDVGSDMKTFRVNVISYPPIFLNSEYLPSVIHFTRSLLSLNCSAESVPAPQFSWSRDSLSLNDAINQGHFSSPMSGILEDNSLSKQDSGNYTCTVSNSVGTIQRSTYITVLDGTKFIYEPSSGTFALARVNYLVCEASVDETLSPSFTWLVNGMKLQTNNRVEYLSPEQGTLIFRNTQLSDTGEYQCIVQAIDNNYEVVFDSSLSSSRVHIQVLDVSAAPTDLLVTNVSTDSLTLTWIPDSSQNSPFFHIFLSIQYMNGTLQTAISYQADSYPATLTGLLPHSLYFIQVSAGSQSVVGPKSLPPLQVLTQQAAPTASPDGLRSYLVNENSLMLVWNHPPERQLDGSGRNGDILSYEITLISQLVSPKTFLTSTNYTSHHLTNLSPYTLYSLIVTAVGREGRSPPSSALLVKTLASEPVRGPEQITCKPVSVTSIACRVVLPEAASRNGYIDGYEVNYREVNEEEWSNKLLRNNANLSATGDVREILLSELLFNNTYSLNISLYNNVSNSIIVGPSVSLGPIVTRNPVPGSPTHLILTDINSISIKATWSLPSRFNSQITGYCLVLTQLSTPYSVELLAVCKNYSELKHTFSSLDANTVYSVSIAAKNDNGLGLELENRVTLNPGPPSPPNFKIFLTGGTVFLKWSPTANGGSPITGYRLEYSWDGSNWLRFHSFNYTELGYQTTSLPFGTFMVRIVAITSLGEGVSEELIITIPNHSLLNELSVQIVIGVTVLLLIILIIVIASCVCILYIRRKKNILHRLHHTEKYFSETQDHHEGLAVMEQFYPQFLTEDQLLTGTNPDFESFGLGDEQVSDAEGKDTHPIPLTGRMLHLSPSLSSLQRPFDLGSYPTWNNPRGTESEFY